MEKIPTIHDSASPEESVVIDNWFEKFVDDIKTDHFLLSTGVATDDKKQFYKDLIFGSNSSLFSQMRNTSSMFFIAQILTDYISEIKSKEKKPLKLALGLTDSKIMVWSVIEDNDDAMEDILLIAEAKVNGKYQKNGFYLTSTITEKSDNLEMPPHYQPIIE